MNAAERRHIPRTMLIGAVLTLIVVILARVEVLRPLERWLYDRRASLFQFFSPEPNDKLVHLDIDDKALAAIGAWPWDRRVLAELVDEIERAQPRVVALDILMPEPQGDADDALAAVVARGGNVVVPVFGIDRKPAKPIEARALELLAADLELSQDDLTEALVKEGWSQRDLPPDRTAQLFIRARERAMLQRVIAELSAGDQPPPSIDVLRARLLPKTDPLVTGSAAIRLLYRQYDRAQAVRALWPSTQPLRDGLPPLKPMEIDQPPVMPLSRSIAATASVEYKPDDGGVLRRVPLWIEADGRLYPQFGLVMACMEMGVDIHDVRIEPDRVVISRSAEQGGDIVVPVRTEQSTGIDGLSIGTLMWIPWFGGDHWQQMYAPRYTDAPPAIEKAGSLEDLAAPRHISITAVWDLRRFIERVETNRRSIDKAIGVLMLDSGDDEARFGLGPDRVATYFATPPTQRTDAMRRSAIDMTLAEVESSGYEREFKSKRDSELSGEERVLRDQLFNALKVLRLAPRENEELALQIDQRRAMLRQSMRDRVVLVGWIASGRMDEERTSLHASCPGAVIHGVIFNALVTGETWRSAPRWIALVITAVLGLLATLAAAYLQPTRALVAGVLIGLTWFVINGLVVFDYGNTNVDLGAPLVAITSVWAGCTLWRFIVENAERARITRRFRSYVDPALVNYVMDHPQSTTLAGQQREMTVVFTDLAGFTTISEQLREKTVPLLNDYMGRMVAAIRAEGKPANRQGFVNKFLGDGIMFFFGAPYENPEHALDAVDTVMRMQEAMGPFNADLAKRGLPGISMRAGISTGLMVVGDAGSAQASDYTVLGDNVNLGARLESANKATGTRVLMTERTYELLAGRILARPVGKLQVVGKAEGVMTYEPLCQMQDARDEDRRLVELSEAVVHAYAAGDFAACRAAIARMDAQLGETKFTKLYCDQFARWGDGASPPDHFDGHVVLASK